MVLIWFYLFCFLHITFPRKEWLLLFFFLLLDIFTDDLYLCFFRLRMSETSFQRGNKVCGKQPQHIQLQYLLFCAILKCKVKLLKLLWHINADEEEKCFISSTSNLYFQHWLRPNIWLTWYIFGQVNASYITYNYLQCINIFNVNTPMFWLCLAHS